MARTALYRHFDVEGRLLYVGITGRPTHRISAHMSKSPWEPEIERMDVRFFATRDGALAAEAIAIRDEAPIHNIRRPDQRQGKRKGLLRKHPELAAYLKDTGQTQIAFAGAVGVARSFVNEMLHGKRCPSLPVARRIDLITGGAVPLSSWANHAAVIAASREAA